MKIHTICLVLALLFAVIESGHCRLLLEQQGEKEGNLAGGVHDRYNGNDISEIESLGRFAVEEHNKEKNSLLEFGKVIKAKEQVVAGKLYYLTLEAIDCGKKKIYEAQVWVKPWMNLKKLQEFKNVDDVSS